MTVTLITGANKGIGFETARTKTGKFRGRQDHER